MDQSNRVRRIKSIKIGYIASMNQLIVKKTLEVNAPASKVWDTLTNRDLTKQYMFSCELISDFKVAVRSFGKGPLMIRCTSKVILLS